MILFAIAAICIGLIALYYSLKSPFTYPYYTHSFDVSGKRGPQIDDFIDSFLLSGGIKEIESHHKFIDTCKER